MPKSNRKTCHPQAPAGTGCRVAGQHAPHVGSRSQLFFGWHLARLRNLRNQSVEQTGCRP